jgi:hypothetical protein
LCFAGWLCFHVDYAVWSCGFGFVGLGVLYAKAGDQLAFVFFTKGGETDLINENEGDI